jgi:hypothetical protein
VVPGSDNQVLTSDGSGGIVAETDFTYNGSDNILTLNRSYDKVNTKTVSNPSTGDVIDTFDYTFGCSAIFEYCITESGGAKRMGQVLSTWDDSSAVFTDISSPDLNSSTATFVWKVTVTSGNVELISTFGSGTWDILVATRIVF